MRFMISAGHSLKCEGACGNGYREHVEATKVMNKVAYYLKQLGATVVTFEDTYSKNQATNLTKIANKHNATNRDYDVSIHFNSAGDPNATGAEVLYHSGTEMKNLSAKVSKAIADTLGIKNRGAKQRSELYFLRKTSKPAILLEICFISNKNDMAKYKANFDDMCKAIAYALMGKTMPAKVDNTKYRLFSGTFATKEDAEAFKAKLLTLVKVAYIRQEGEKYRVFTGTFTGKASATEMATKVKKLTGFKMTAKEA